MLKNQLHAMPDQVSAFRLWTVLPIYFAFIFGFIRDRWTVFGLRDRGLFLIFGPLAAFVFFWLAVQKVTVVNL